MRVFVYGKTWATRAALLVSLGLAAGCGAGPDPSGLEKDAGNHMVADSGMAADAGMTADAGETGGYIPCDVQAVLKASCQGCHSNPPVNGAPFPLVTLEDVRASYFSTTVREASVSAVQQGQMPLPPYTLGSAEKDILLGWLKAGAPGATGSTCP